ncbi:MAG: DUF433 domain-containing protein [Candidatus Poribacteria bacterium]
MERIELSKYVVSDLNICQGRLTFPHVCHEQLTFKGTRVMVGPVLAMFALGYTIKDILAGYGSLTREMIEEAQLLAVQYLEKDFPAKPQLWEKDTSLPTKELAK